MRWGQLANDGTNTYAWDARNHLVGISGPASASFVYDPFGRRAAKSVTGATTQFLYDRWNPVQELDGASPPNVVANLLTGLRIDEYFSRTDSAGAATILADALGSTLGLTDASGALNTTYTYEPFGNVTISGAANAIPFQFTGRENDGTGLYFYRARYYSPTLQRFIAQDPIELRGGVNLYAAMSDDPIDHSDPLGLFWLVFPVAPGGGTPFVWAFHYQDDSPFPDSGGLYKLNRNFNEYPCNLFPGLACTFPDPAFEPQPSCGHPPSGGPLT